MPIPILDLVKIPVILRFDLDQNGRFIVYSSNETGILQLYVLAMEPGSKPKQITYGKDPVMSGFISPQGDKLVYQQDKDGNETHHLFLIPLEGGEAKRITKTPYRMWGGVDWHPSGKEATRAFTSMTSSGLETRNLETGECFMLKEPTPPLEGVQYSHDGKWIVCAVMATYKSEQILIVNRNDPSDTIVYSSKEDSIDMNPSWSPDDKWLAFMSDARGTNQMVIQKFQGEERSFLELDKDEEVFQFGRAVWNPEGDMIYYVVNKHSQTTVRGHSIDGKERATLPFPEGTVEFPRVDKNGKVVAVNHSSLISPYGIYIHKIGSDSATLLTPRNCKVDLSQLAHPRSVWYKSFDGRQIHGWYLPATMGTTPHPAVTYAHGGPWMQVFDAWLDAPLLHCLSQNGFAVFAPNFRGSTGYGAEFQKLDIGDIGGGDLEDLIHGAGWLGNQSDIDSSKIAVVGASYGGYLTLMALTRRPEVFTAGVSVVPVVDWLGDYELADPYFRSFDHLLFGGPPSEKEELYRDRSPITHVTNIKAPVMIMASKQDARCPIQPTEKFVAKLKEMNHPHKFVLQEKAGHTSGLFKWEEAISTFTSIINYLQEVLVLH